MIVIIAVVLIVLVVFLLALIKILFWLSKYFKLENVTFKKSAMIILYLIVTGSVVMILLEVFNLGILYIIFELLLFHYFLKKYYNNSWKKSLSIYIIFTISYVALSLMMIIPVRTYIFEPYFVAGESMSPALNQDDYLIIDKYSKSYQSGDIVVIYNDLQRGYLIKRVIGLPNDKVEIKNGKVFINEIELNEEYIYQEVFPNKLIVLSNDEYFVLGDNLSKSADSRHFGAIKGSDIIGEVVYNLNK